MTESKALTAGSEGKALAMIALDLGMQSSFVDDAADLVGHVPDAKLAIKEQMRPLKDVEPNGTSWDDTTERFLFTGPRHKIISDGLRPIGIKISGRMSPGEANAWLGAMLLALSDLPFAHIRFAIGEVIHTPMKFLNEVEGELRIHARRAKTRHDVALSRLNRLQQELERASSETKALPGRDPMTDDDLQAMSEPLRRIGIGAGWLIEDENGKLSWKDEDE